MVGDTKKPRNSSKLKKEPERPGAVKITLHSANNEIDEKAEVTIALANPENAMEKMLNTLAHRFPPESVMTISPAAGLACSSSEGASFISHNDCSSASESHKQVRDEVPIAHTSANAAATRSRQSNSPRGAGSASLAPSGKRSNSPFHRESSYPVSNQGTASSYSFLPDELRQEMKLFEPDLVQFLLDNDSKLLDDHLKFAQAGEDPKGWAVAQNISVELSRAVVDQLIADPSFFAWLAKVSGALKQQRQTLLMAAGQVPPVRIGSKSSSSAQRKQGNQSTGIRSHSSSSASSKDVAPQQGARQDNGYAVPISSGAFHSFGYHKHATDNKGPRPLYGENGKALVGPDGRYLVCAEDGHMITGDGRRVSYKNGKPFCENGSPLTDDRGRPHSDKKGRPLLNEGCPVLGEDGRQTTTDSGRAIFYGPDGVPVTADGAQAWFGADGRTHSKGQDSTGRSSVMSAMGQDCVILHGSDGQPLLGPDGGVLIANSSGVKTSDGQTVEYDPNGVPYCGKEVLCGPNGRRLVDGKGRHLLRPGATVYDSGRQSIYTLDGQKLVFGPNGGLCTASGMSVTKDAAGNFFSETGNKRTEVQTRVQTQSSHLSQSDNRGMMTQTSQHLANNIVNGIEEYDASGLKFTPAAKQVYGPTGSALTGPDGKPLMISEAGRLVLGDLKTFIEFEGDGTPVYGNGRVLVDERGKPVLGPRGEPILGNGRPLFDNQAQVITIAGQPVVFTQNGYVVTGEGKLIKFDNRNRPHVMNITPSGTISGTALSSSTSQQVINGRYSTDPASGQIVTSIKTATSSQLSPMSPANPMSIGRSSSVMDNGELGERLEMLPDGTRVRYVEVPVYEEKIITVTRKEVREVEKRVPKIEYVDVETIVEVPQLEYIDKHVEVEQIQEVVRHVPRREVVDVPREVVRHVPRIETKYVEKVVEVPGQIIEVPQPYTVENKVNVPVYQDSHVPSVVAQRLQPIIKNNGEVNEVEAMHYEPVLFPIDVYIPKPVASQFIALGKRDEVHHVVDVPPAQFNTLLLNMNLGVPDSALDDLFLKMQGGSIPMLPTSEHGEVVQPMSNVRIPGVRETSMPRSMPPTYQMQPSQGYRQMATVEEHLETRSQPSRISAPRVPSNTRVKSNSRSIEPSSTRKEKSRQSTHSSKRAQSTRVTKSRQVQQYEEQTLTGAGSFSSSNCSITSSDIRKLRKELAEAEVEYTKHHHHSVSTKKSSRPH